MADEQPRPVDDHDVEAKLLERMGLTNPLLRHLAADDIEKLCKRYWADREQQPAVVGQIQDQLEDHLKASAHERRLWEALESVQGIIHVAEQLQGKSRQEQRDAIQDSLSNADYVPSPDELDDSP